MADRRLTSETQKSSGNTARSANLMKSPSKRHSWRIFLTPLAMKKMDRPAANPLYTGAYSNVGRGCTIFVSMSMTAIFLPYQVRLYLVFGGSAFSGSEAAAVADRLVLEGTVRMPPTPNAAEATRDVGGVWKGFMEWPETEASAETGGEATPGFERHNNLIRRSSKSCTVGIMLSREADQITRTRSSRYGHILARFLSNHNFDLR